MRQNCLLLLALFVQLLPAIGQNTSLPNTTTYPYLLRIDTMNFETQTCVLLHGDGEFHLENERGDRTRVFEGKLPEAKLLEIEKIINDDRLRSLSQSQIVQPKGGILLDELHIHIFRGDHWQSVFFPDRTTRKPFDDCIAPLVRWLENFPEERHVELTEDEGKNDCRFPKRIVLKRRKDNVPP